MPARPAIDGRPLAAPVWFLPEEFGAGPASVRTRPAKVDSTLDVPA